MEPALLTLDPAILGRILLLQSAVQAAPDELRLAEALAACFSELPGVECCIVCLGRGAQASKGIALPASCDLPPSTHGNEALLGHAARRHCVHPCGLAEGWNGWQHVLQTPRSIYGTILLRFNDPAAFSIYDPFVVNTGNLAALHLENTQIAARVQSLNRDLQGEVVERTEELQRSEERFRVLSENVPQLVWTCAPDGPCDYLNQRWTEYTGRALTDLLGWGWMQVLHPEDRQHTVDAWNATVLRDAPLDVEFRIRNREGAYRWFKTRARVLRDSEGRVLRWFGTCTDIHDERQATEAMRMSESRLRLTLAAAQAGTWDWEIATRTITASREYRRLCGLDPDKPQDDPDFWWTLVHPDDRARIRAQIDQAARLSSDLNIEFRVRHPDGSFRWLLSRAQPVRDANGRAYRYHGIALDITERRHAEEALRASEERYRLISDNTADVIWTFDLQSMRFTYVSPSVQRLRGYTPEEILSFEPTQTMTPRSAEIVAGGLPARLEAFSAGDASAAMRVQEVEQYRKDGSIVTTEVSTTVVGNEHRTPLKIIGVTRDITERKRAESELREAHHRMANILEQMRDAFVTYDRDWRYTYVNPAAERLFGMSASALLGHCAWEVFPAARETPFYRYHVQAMQEHRAVQTEVYYAPIRRWLDLRCQPTTDGVAAYLTDITARKHAEQQLRESESLFRTLFEESPVGAILADPVNHTILDCNDIAASALGYTREELMQLHTPDLGVTPTGEDFSRMQQAVMVGEAAQLDTALRTRNGETRDFLVKATLIQYRGRDATYVTLIDITERKRASQALAESREQLHRLNAELEQRVRERTTQLAAANHELEAFVYSVSHDLRAPLRGIDGWSLALQEDYAGSLDSQGQQYLGRVRTETRRMENLIEDLLQLSRVTRGDINRTSVDLTALAERIMERLRQQEPDRCIEWVNVPGITAFGDARLLDIVLTNLIGNAVKYTGRTVHARVEFSSVLTNGQWIYTVRDNGAGFDMQFAGMLFAPFQRLHKQSDFPGIGVGLATVQRIVHRHGGRIWAESQPGCGATFFFTIPDEQGTCPQDIASVHSA